jgi:hypothetical protein
MVRTACGLIGADARPNWQEYRAAGTERCSQWAARPLQLTGRLVGLDPRAISPHGLRSIANRAAGGVL